MTRFELNSVWHDRFGDYKVAENDGDNIIAEYVDGEKVGEMKLFDSGDETMILRIHNNIMEEEKLMIKRERAARAGKAHKESVANLADTFKRAPKDKVIVGPDNDSIFCAMLMQKVFGSKVVGVFDLTTFKINEGVDPRDCFFLDIELFVEGYYSIGNHMNCVHSDCFNSSFLNKTKNCINADLANRISQKEYQNKYPSGTNVLLMLMMEKTGVAPSSIGIDNNCLFNSVAHSDGTANSIFNTRYFDNNIHWIEEFFGGSETGDLFLRPILELNAFTKHAVDTSFDIGGKTVTNVNKKVMRELRDLKELQAHVRYLYHCMGVEFNSDLWPVFDNYDGNLWDKNNNNTNSIFHALETNVTDDTTKNRNMHLYSEESNMVTSCIRKGGSMDYSSDINNIF